jgi:hypothetical protein
MRTKIKFSDYTGINIRLRDAEEAMDEVRRELDVRRKIYDRWVMEGRISWTDAHDRMERLITALRMLIELPVQPEVTEIPLDSQDEAA